MNIDAFQNQYFQTRESSARRYMLMAVLEEHSLTESVDNCGKTLIHFIVKHGDLEDIDYMLFMLSGTEIDTPNALGQTALIKSIIAGRQSVTSLLLHHGADPTLLDQYGYSAFDYNAQRKAPLKLEAETIIPILPSIWLHLDKLRTAADMRVFLDWLTENHYPLDKIISSTDKSILHYMLHFASLAAIEVLLPHIPKEMLIASNAQHESLLQSLMNNDRYVYASVLIHHMKQFISRHHMPFRLNNGTVVFDRSIEAYLQVHRLLKHLAEHFNVDEVLREIQTLGFELDEPINEADETVLHYLVDMLPIDSFRSIIRSNPKLNLNVKSLHRKSLFLQALKRERIPMMKLLADEGIDCHFNALTAKVSKEYVEYCGRKHKGTAYAYLHRLFNEIKKTSSSNQACAIACFELYVEYIKKKGFKYDGCERNGEHFLDEPTSMSFTVNCFDLTTAFGYLLSSIGIKELYLHRYSHIKSRRFSDKGKLQGDFICFDSGFHDNKGAHKGSFAFSMHTVLRVGNRLFDPTFNCHYAHPDDIQYPRPAGRQLQVIEAVVTSRITSEPANYRRFKLQFLAKLHTFLPPETCQYVFYGNSLRISREFTTINISDDAGRLYITTQFYPAHRVADIIDAWVISNKAIQLKINAGGTHSADINYLTKQYGDTQPRPAKQLRK